MLVSFTLQCVAVTVGVIISILTVDKLGAFSLPQPMPPAPRLPRAMTLIPTDAHVGARVSTGPFVEFRPVFQPTRIPQGVPRFMDGPEMVIAQVGSSAGSYDPVAGAIAADGMNVGRVAPPPPPPPAPKPTEAAAETKQVRVHASILAAKLVQQVMPVYPPLARQMRLSGTVRLEAVIGRDGRVAHLQVASGHPVFIPAAVDAVRQWVYRPTLLKATPWKWSRQSK